MTEGARVNVFVSPHDQCAVTFDHHTRKDVQKKPSSAQQEAGRVLLAKGNKEEEDMLITSGGEGEFVRFESV